MRSAWSNLSNPRSWVAALLALALIGGAVSVVLAQDGPFFGRRWRQPVVIDNEIVPYDGRFTFVRLRYRSGGFRDEPWAHDYPRAERNFMRILDEISMLRVHVDESNIIGLGDPELFNYPIAYMSEPGFWTMTPEEADNLRAYMTKGGFLIFDDFRGGHWYNFEEQVRALYPQGRLTLLDATHPIFHSFFEIDSLDFLQFYDRREQPMFYGLFEDNDPDKRLLLIANYNNDIGEYWEFSDQGYVPIDLSNEAYKLGVNYVMYAMTH